MSKTMQTIFRGKDAASNYGLHLIYDDETKKPTFRFTFLNEDRLNICIDCDTFAEAIARFTERLTWDNDLDSDFGLV